MTQRQFIWTDDLVARFVTWSLTESPTFQGRYADIEQFKKMHSSLSVEDVLQERNAQPSEYKGSLTRPLTPNEAYPPAAAAEPKGKEWEILVIQAENGSLARKTWKTFEKKSEYRFVWDSDKDSMGYYEDFMLAGQTNKIHSVRRLSDNEVFAVGDWFSNNTGNIYSEHKIERFDVKEGEIFVYYELGNGRFYKSLKRLKKIAPTRTPLFTTTDGKPVYEGDEYWFVWRTKYGNNLYDYAKNKAVKDSDSGASKDDKYFSTQAAAEQWIADNKPLYSLNDLLAALPDEASKDGIAANLRAKKK